MATSPPFGGRRVVLSGDGQSDAHGQDARHVDADLGGIASNVGARPADVRPVGLPARVHAWITAGLWPADRGVAELRWGAVTLAIMAVLGVIAYRARSGQWRLRPSADGGHPRVDRGRDRGLGPGRHADRRLVAGAARDRPVGPRRRGRRDGPGRCVDADDPAGRPAGYPRHGLRRHDPGLPDRGGRHGQLPPRSCWSRTGRSPRGSASNTS